MSDEDSPPESGARTPSQIPLLDDVVADNGPTPKRPRRGKPEKNLELKPDPDLPQTGDLFAEAPAAPPPATGPASNSQPGRSGEDLRTQASDVVDRLVHEYAREMIVRLREELTQLLEELDEPDAASAAAAAPGEKIWDGPPLSAWHPWLPVEVARRLEDTTASWCVAGGWAVDLFLQSQTRLHDDIEIAIPRSHFWRLTPHFSDCEFFTAKDGEVRRLRRHDPVPDDVHQVWIVERRTGEWRLDIMLEPGDADTWIYRREPSLALPRAELVLCRNRIPFLAPEAVLLYKAKALRDKDAADFEQLRPHLDDARRRWLAASIRRTHGDHPWLAVL